MEKYLKLSQNYPCYFFLSGVLHKLSIIIKNILLPLIRTTFARWFKEGQQVCFHNCRLIEIKQACSTMPHSEFYIYIQELIRQSFQLPIYPHTFGCFCNFSSDWLDSRRYTVTFRFSKGHLCQNLRVPKVVYYHKILITSRNKTVFKTNV